MRTDRCTIFYSWQSDDPKTSRYIRKSLEDAIKNIKKEIGICTRPELDEATKGKYGAVDITTCVMEKIRKSELFVADLSIVGEYNDRKAVNQNVLFELGYAMRGGEGENVIILFNSDKGSIRDLPFDISHRRIKQFSIEDDKKGKKLSSDLKSIIQESISRTDGAIRKPDELELDTEERTIMEFFNTMGEKKHIILAKELDGFRIYPMDEQYDSAKLHRIMELGETKLIANLDDLVDRNILEKTPSLDHNATHYKLKKLGFNMLEKF